MADAPVLVLVSDLMLRSRLEEGLRLGGYAMRAAAGPVRLREALAAARPPCVLVDLEAGGVDTVAVIAGLRDDPATADLPVLAFCGHTEEALMDRARAAGATRVVARGQAALSPARLVADLTRPTPG